MLRRRGFLGSILSAGFAPAFIGSQVLMPVKAIATPGIWTPDEVACFDDMIRDMEQVGALLDAQPVPEVGRTIIGAGLSRGDIFTIAGDKTHYRVTRVVSGVAHIKPW